MLKNVNIIVTERCNSRCKNCHIWQKENTAELSAQEIADMFLLEEFQGIEEVGLSGGEPFLRKDIGEIIAGISKNAKNLKNLYLTTNASLKNKVMDTCEMMSQLNLPGINIGVSLEGTPEIHEKIRGVNSYNQAVDLLKSIKEKYANINTSISLTICEENCRQDVLHHVYELSRELNCTLSFRIATESEYYDNIGEGFVLSEEARKILVNFILEHDLNDAFMREQLYYLLTNKIPVMHDYQADKSICQAGKKFLFIQSNGDFNPCLYSNEVIGNYKDGIVEKKELYLTEACPCMTECTIWPMLLK